MDELVEVWLGFTDCQSTVGGDPSCNKNSMRICPDTLQWVMNIAGVDARRSEKFLQTTLPVNYTQLHHSDDRDVPTSISECLRPFQCQDKLTCTTTSSPFLSLPPDE